MENGGSDDNGPEPDDREKRRYNNEHKNALPGLVTPGDSGIEDQSDSEFDDVLEEENPNKEDNHFKGTAFFDEYFDKSRNAPGSTKVEDHELKCPMLITGEPCKVHKSEEDMKIVSYMCPLVASPSQCINPEHSEVDHEPRQCADPEHNHELEANVINFITTLRHTGGREMDDDEEREKR